MRLALWLALLVGTTWGGINEQSCGTTPSYDTCVQSCCSTNGAGTLVSLSTGCSCGVAGQSCPSTPSGLSCCQDKNSNVGNCFQPSTGRKCCQWGDTSGNFPIGAGVYDPMAGNNDVCCSLNGIVSDGSACVCKADTDCPGNFKCCFDSTAQFQWNAGNQAFNNDPPAITIVSGFCYDPSIRQCAKFPLHKLQATVYNPTVMQFCHATEQLLNIGTTTRCPCDFTDTNCPAGSVCCLPPAGYVGDKFYTPMPCGLNQCGGFCRGFCTLPNAGEQCLWCGNSFTFTAGQACGTFNANSPNFNAISAGQTPYDTNTQKFCPRDGAAGFQTVCSCLQNSDCATGEICCGDGTSGQCINPNINVPYKEYSNNGNNVANYQMTACCKWGDNNNNWTPYNAQYQQCCPHDGVVSQTARCSCLVDSHCPSNRKCCVNNFQKQWNPVCTSKVTQCAGGCIEPDYELCCDGDMSQGICMKAYQQCCGSICCNKLTQGCVTGRDKGNPFNSNANAYYCSSVAHYTSARGFWAYGFPTLLLLFTIFALLVTLKMGMDSFGGFDGLPKVMAMLAVFLGILSDIFCFLLLFSQLWKYAVTAIVTNVVVAVGLIESRGRWWPRIAFIVSIYSMIYLVSPFGVSGLLVPFNIGTSFNGQTTGGMRNDGLLISSVTPTSCTNFYDYFQLDATSKNNYINNPSQTAFGLCQPGWLFTVSVVTGIVLFLQMMVFLCSFAMLVNPGAGSGAVPQYQDGKPLEQPLMPMGQNF